MHFNYLMGKLIVKFLENQVSIVRKKTYQHKIIRWKCKHETVDMLDITSNQLNIIVISAFVFLTV